MIIIIDNYDSFTYNLVQAFYALGHKPVVLHNDDPAVLEMAANPELVQAVDARMAERRQRLTALGLRHDGTAARPRW